MIDLVGVCPMTWALADHNAATWVHPMCRRRGRPGLVPLSASAIWTAIKRGTFPAPVIVAERIAWRLDAVQRWRQQRNAARTRK